MVTAVDKVNLTVEQGELFGLLGPNGAGKTTLIKLLCTLIVPTAGTARINGYDLWQETAIKASIGLVTGDERSFYWRLSGRQNLEFFAALHGFSPDPARRRVQEVLDLVELAEVADEQFQTYSTGMRQRLSIARGLLHVPQLLFLDELTKSLDPMATRHMHDLIKNRLVGQEGVTVFLATHRLEEAEQLCHRVAIMDQGRIRACGTIPELRARLRPDTHYRLKVRVFQPAMRDEIAKLVTNLQVTFLDDQDALLEFTALNGEEILSLVIDVVRDNGGEIRALRSEAVPLEEVFAYLTGEPARAAKSLLVTR
jgi:ABC-2 type transport system ATP-binding protein